MTSQSTPLIAASEGASGCPAFRGIAYVVFENLQLGDFGNRIPALTFEIFAGSGERSVAMLFDGVIDEVDAEVPLTGVQGTPARGSIEATLRQFNRFSRWIDAAGEQLVVAPVAGNRTDRAERGGRQCRPPRFRQAGGFCPAPWLPHRSRAARCCATMTLTATISPPPSARRS